MADFIYMSAEGIAKLEAEIAHLRSVERPAVVQAIAEARDKGDLSENAEYDAAREAQAMLELKISKLEQTLARARAIDTSKIDLSKVQIYCRVKMRNLTLKRDMEYTLVAESEANVREGKLSIGMTTQNTIEISGAKNVLTVPTMAVKKQGGKTVVRVLGKDGKAAEREVQTGLKDGVNTEIKSGVNEGEQVVISEMTAAEQEKSSEAVMMGGPPPGR